MNRNFLIIMADEHNRKVCGAYGNDTVQTPNLDALAARGTRFANAYTPCPICVPARAAFATGLPVNRTGYWDNSYGYTGEPPSWAHALSAAGREVVSIGKLHYRSAEDDLGFHESIEPMYVKDGVGDILGCVREPLPVRWATHKIAEEIGPGESTYTHYDRRIRDAAVDWIEEKARTTESKPWTAFVSFVAPHFPLIAPEPFYALYEGAGLMPQKTAPDDEHPWLQALRGCYLYDNFDEERTRIALAAYYGLVSFMDDNVGHVLGALESTGLSESTVVLYVSDHGDNAGERGMWGKSTMYEESAGIPAILAGPGVPEAKVSETPVTLMDVYPTALHTAGLTAENTRLSTSLLSLAQADDTPSRVAFSEYHAGGSASGAFMIRRERWKYVFYVGFPPQLFDLADDPEEQNDLGASPAHVDIRRSLHDALLEICNPEEVDASAKSDQQQKVAHHGGRDAVVEKGSFGATPAPK